jgi:hypothetical protein
VAEQTYGVDHLDLVLANGYIAKLLRNSRVVGYWQSTIPSGCFNSRRSRRLVRRRRECRCRWRAGAIYQLRFAYALLWKKPAKGHVRLDAPSGLIKIHDGRQQWGRFC